MKKKRPPFQLMIETSFLVEAVDPANVAAPRDPDATGPIMYFRPVELDAGFSEGLKAQKARKRGDRTKLFGGRALELAAVAKLKEHRDEIRVQRGEKRHTTFSDYEDSPFEQALKEVASLFGVSPSTLRDWYRGVNKRRRKPNPKARSFTP